jgi:hypothetical protein
MSSRSLSDENFEELRDFPQVTRRGATPAPGFETRGALFSSGSMILDIRAPRSSEEF